MKLFQKNRIFAYFFPVFMALTATVSYAPFYGIDIYKKTVTNPDGSQKDRFRIFGKDMHIGYADGSCREQQHALLRDLLRMLKQQKQKIIIAVEQMSHYTGNNDNIRRDLLKIDSLRKSREKDSRATRELSKQIEDLKKKTAALKGIPYTPTPFTPAIYDGTSLDNIIELAQQEGIEAVNAEFRHASGVSGTYHNPVYARQEILATMNTVLNTIKTAQERNPNTIPKDLYAWANGLAQECINRYQNHSSGRDLDASDITRLKNIQCLLMDAMVFLLINEHEEQNYDTAFYLFGGAHIGEGRFSKKALEEYMRVRGYTKIRSIGEYIPYSEEAKPQIMANALKLEKELRAFMALSATQPQRTPVTPTPATIIRSTAKKSALTKVIARTQKMPTPQPVKKSLPLAARPTPRTIKPPVIITKKQSIPVKVQPKKSPAPTAKTPTTRVIIRGKQHPVAPPAKKTITPRQPAIHSATAKLVKTLKTITHLDKRSRTAIAYHIKPADAAKIIRAVDPVLRKALSMQDYRLFASRIRSMQHTKKLSLVVDLFNKIIATLNNAFNNHATLKKLTSSDITATQRAMDQLLNARFCNDARCPYKIKR